MSVYERTFGTDWDELDRDEVLHRAFAIGVAESLDEPVPGDELDRLRSQVSGRYGRSLVDLAYDEGRTKGRKPGGEQDTGEVWSDLVEAGDDEPSVGGRPTHGDRPSRQTDLPDVISRAARSALDRDELARFRFPEFLR